MKLFNSSCSKNIDTEKSGNSAFIPTILNIRRHVFIGVNLVFNMVQNNPVICQKLLQSFRLLFLTGKCQDIFANIPASYIPNADKFMNCSDRLCTISLVERGKKHRFPLVHNSHSGFLRDIAGDNLRQNRMALLTQFPL